MRTNSTERTQTTPTNPIKQSIIGAHKATHGHGEATSQHNAPRTTTEGIKPYANQSTISRTTTNLRTGFRAAHTIPTVDSRELHTSKEKPIPAPPHGVANPASRSDTGFNKILTRLPSVARKQRAGTAAGTALTSRRSPALECMFDHTPFSRRCDTVR